MSEEDNSKARPRWRPEEPDRMTVHSVYIDDATWQVAQDAARDANFTVSSWVRMAVHEYTSQTRKVPVPEGTEAAMVARLRRNVRANAAMWEALSKRAYRERITRSAVVACAIMFAAERAAAAEKETV